MANIALIDVDTYNFPNLPLMKISAYHKRLGDVVSFYEAFIGTYKPYDRVYISKIFTFTEDYLLPIYADEIVYGGTGYGLISGFQNKYGRNSHYMSNLTPEIEHIFPDYTLYPQYSESYGFLTRGCPRNCPFCIVSQKEGRVSQRVADLDCFHGGQRTIKLLDPNILACKDRYELLEQLIASKAYIDFTQGLDIRLIDKDVTELIMRCKIKMLHFAWDNEHDSDIVCRKLQQFKKQSGIDVRKARVYMLTNYDTTFEFDLYRVYTLKQLGFDPYVMVYNKETAPKNITMLQRWVNNKRIFRSGSAERFEQYKVNIGAVSTEK